MNVIFLNFCCILLYGEMNFSYLITRLIVNWWKISPPPSLDALHNIHSKFTFSPAKSPVSIFNDRLPGKINYANSFPNKIPFSHCAFQEMTLINLPRYNFGPLYFENDEFLHFSTYRADYVTINAATQKLLLLLFIIYFQEQLSDF